MTLKLTNQLTLANNIFYNPLKGFVVNLNADIGVKISGNIFMRDTAHMQPGLILTERFTLVVIQHQVASSICQM